MNTSTPTINPLERPRYGMASAARHVGISPSTLRSWVVGRSYQTTAGESYSEPLIERPFSGDSRLSFSNLAEAHVLRSLRTRHDVRMSAVREALNYAEERFKIKRLLLSDELRTAAGKLFIERLGEIIELSPSGQLAMAEIFMGHLKRIDRGITGFPLRLFPVIASLGFQSPHIVTIDPNIAFGRPFIAGKGVRTSTIVERLDANEPRDLVATDYGLNDSEIDAAILYERAA
ncbi:MAG TPA: DUF433 domain-containing protein [Thermoanaerobaculia bacterium]|nr:DUF433 domain-containing protein [Thermoanaerobaculia bacterium]